MAKSSVSALHEFCAKNRLMSPVFDFITVDEGFVCRVSINDCSAEGIGRSKRDAKHIATAHMIKKMKLELPEIAEIHTVEQADIPTIDTYAALRDFCVQNDYPLPQVEIVQQGGSPDAPLFVAKCQVASVKRYGHSEKKKDAKQLAAHAVFVAISHSYIPEMKLQLSQTLEAKQDELEYERRNKFRCYRELTGLKENTYNGVKLIDRHLYFKKYKPEIKKAALMVLNSRDYPNYQAQATDLFEALKLNPRITKEKTEKSIKQFTLIEIDCDYDALFADYEPEVYKQVVEYFKIMIQ